MAARKPLTRNNEFEEAMALLIRNQAAFVEQFARNDEERGTPLDPRSDLRLKVAFRQSFRAATSPPTSQV